jgi:hypothetical protein
MANRSLPDKEIYMGIEVQKRAKELNIDGPALAKSLKTTKQNVFKIYKRKVIDAEQLYELSKILSFDFHSLYSKKLMQDQQYKGSREYDSVFLREINQNLQQSIADYQKLVKLYEEKLECLKSETRNKKQIISK